MLPFFFSWLMVGLTNRVPVWDLHCPQFGLDRTEPTGPGFGPL